MNLSEVIMLGILVYAMVGCYKAAVDASKYLSKKEED